jgi:segregation and condensation protein A
MRIEAPDAAVGDTGAPELRLGAWEGPLDLLLELARARKVDLAALSITDLAEQFGVALRAGVAQRRVPLPRLGDWLVMAAHLALLRSRLLLPADRGEREAAERDVAALRRRLADREHARRLADWLERRPQLGREVFARGAAERDDGPTAAPAADVAALLRACLVVLERSSPAGAYRPAPLALWRVADALARLRRLLPGLPDGAPLERFLPEPGGDDAPDAALLRRAALASTLLAGLELCRDGAAALSQAKVFDTINIAAAASQGGTAPKCRPSPGLAGAGARKADHPTDGTRCAVRAGRQSAERGLDAQRRPRKDGCRSIGN